VLILLGRVLEKPLELGRMDNINFFDYTMTYYEIQEKMNFQFNKPPFSVSYIKIYKWCEAENKHIYIISLNLFVYRLKIFTAIHQNYMNSVFILMQKWLYGSRNGRFIFKNLNAFLKKSFYVCKMRKLLAFQLVSSFLLSQKSNPAKIRTPSTMWVGYEEKECRVTGCEFFLFQIMGG
jgi:hypothetical protein